MPRIQPHNFFSDNSYVLSNNESSVSSSTITTVDSTISSNTTASLKISQLPPEVVTIRKLPIEEMLMQTDPFALSILSFLGL